VLCLTRSAEPLCCERHTLLGKEASKNVCGRQSLLKLVMHMQHQGLNERLAMFARLLLGNTISPVRSFWKCRN
jgi:hypothetical protein